MKFKKYLENPKIKDLLVVGGVQIRDQISSLNAGVSSSSYKQFNVMFYLRGVFSRNTIEGLWSITQGKNSVFNYVQTNLSTSVF